MIIRYGRLEERPQGSNRHCASVAEILAGIGPDEFHFEGIPSESLGGSDLVEPANLAACGGAVPEVEDWRFGSTWLSDPCPRDRDHVPNLGDPVDEKRRKRRKLAVFLRPVASGPLRVHWQRIRKALLEVQLAPLAQHTGQPNSDSSDSSAADKGTDGSGGGPGISDLDAGVSELIQLCTSEQRVLDSSVLEEIWDMGETEFTTLLRSLFRQNALSTHLATKFAHALLLPYLRALTRPLSRSTYSELSRICADHPVALLHGLFVPLIQGDGGGSLNLRPHPRDVLQRLSRESLRSSHRSLLVGLFVRDSFLALPRDQESSPPSQVVPASHEIWMESTISFLQALFNCLLDQDTLLEVRLDSPSLVVLPHDPKAATTGLTPGGVYRGGWSVIQGFLDLLRTNLVVRTSDVMTALRSPKLGVRLGLFVVSLISKHSATLHICAREDWFKSLWEGIANCLTGPARVAVRRFSNNVENNLI